MSLISLLRGDAINTTSAADSVLNTLTQNLSAQRSAASVAAAKVVQGATSSSTSVSGSTTAQITPAARQAAAGKADAATAATTLANQIRAELDAQYKASGTKSDASLSGLSNRALALAALDETGQFSAEEAYAARTEMRARDRASLMEVITSTGLSAASLAKWQTAQSEARSAMSTEELTLRIQDNRLLKST